MRPFLNLFLAAYPDVQIEVFQYGGVSDIVTDGFDAGIRLGQFRHQSEIVIALAGGASSFVDSRLCNRRCSPR